MPRANHIRRPGRYGWSVMRLSGAEWRGRRDAYQERANAALAGVLHRRRMGLRHPVEDFLFSYYTTRPARLLTWTPGLGVTLIRNWGGNPTSDGLNAAECRLLELGQNI